MFTNRFQLKLLTAVLGASFVTACAPTSGGSDDKGGPILIIDNGPQADGDDQDPNDTDDRDDNQRPDDDDDSQQPDDERNPNDNNDRDPNDNNDPEPEPEPERDPTNPLPEDCRGADCPPDEDAELHVVEDGDRHCLHIGQGPRFGVNVCGDWRWDPRRRGFTASGDLAVVTPVGEFPLNEAELRASLNPVSLVGSAAVPFPAIGFLEQMGIEGAAPSAQIAFAPGRDLGTIEINGQDMELDPDAYYLMFDYATGMSAEMNGVSISTPGQGSTMVVAPEEPLIFVGGDLAGALTGGLIEDAAFGFSLDGRLPYETENELYDGQDWAPMQLTGHIYAQGSVQIGAYPVSIAARTIIDADADDDGQTIFEGDTRDIALGADGSVSMGYSRAGFDLSVEVGSASLVYDASQGDVGHLYFYGRQGMEELFSDTPLSFITPNQATTEIYGLYRDTDDFALGVIWNGRIGPFQMEDATIQLGSQGVEVAATMLPPVGRTPLGDQHIAFHGSVHPDGRYSLTGEAHVDVLGYRLAGATLTLNPTGLAVAGDAEIPYAGSVDFAGSLEANGQFSMSGAANATIAGFQLANGRVAMNNAGATMTGRIAIPGMGNADVSGRIDGANTSLTGRADLTPGGFRMAGAAVTLGRNGVHVAGRVNLPGVGGVDVSGNVPANGAFALTGNADLTPAGIRIAGAAVTVRSNGARIAGRAGFGGTGFDVSGEAYSDGRYSFSGSVGIDVGIFGGSVTLTIANGRASATFAGRACVVIPDPCASRERVCVWTPWGDECSNICVPGTSRACHEVRESVSSNGQICVNLPVVGRECADIL